MKPLRQAAIVVSAVVCALAVGIIVGGALSGAPVLGGLLAFTASVLVGMSVFTYLAAIHRRRTEKIADALENAADKANSLLDRAANWINGNPNDATVATSS